MTTKTTDALGKFLVRIGLISRIDYPDDGFRLALLKRAAEDFAKENVDYIILAGGLISGRAIKAKQMKSSRQIRVWKAQMTKLFKEQAKLERSAPKRGKGRKKADAAKDEKELEAKKAEIKAKVAEVVKSIRCLQAKVEAAAKQLEELSEERLAANLAELLPKFVNAKGEPVKVFIIPSPAYDGAIGENVAQLLAAKRSEDIRVYSSGVVPLPIKGSKKVIEVLTPGKAVWMRGDYMSTAAERVLKDRDKQRNSAAPDIQVVGCFGVTITKPRGEKRRPYVAVPILHRLAETRVAENQIGVRVMDVYADRVDPAVRTCNYRNFVSQERRFIGKPLGDISSTANRLIELLKTNGRYSTGMLASDAKVSRETVMKELGEIKSTRNSPGLVYDPASNCWDFDLEWIKIHLRYPAPTDNTQVDSIAAYSCLHAGSIYTDYQGFVETMTKVILNRGDTVLVGAGDFVAGTKHNLVLSGEVFGGLNVTQQEIIAAETLAEINIRVFRDRFLGKLETLQKEHKDGNVPADKLTDAIKSSLLLNVIIAGNHDAWTIESGSTPLVVMKLSLVRSIRAAIENILVEKNLLIPRLYELVESKIVEPEKGFVILPSGLKMSLRHPYMARAKTTSLRPQEMLDADYDSHIVIGGNFHVGEHLEVWDAEYGQRVCLQCGTIQTRTDFENNKLKIVDQGFGCLRIESLNGKIIRTECTFFTTNPADDIALKRDKALTDVLQYIKSAK